MIDLLKETGICLNSLVELKDITLYTSHKLTLLCLLIFKI